jgi:hypothetical protein
VRARQGRFGLQGSSRRGPALAAGATPPAGRRRAAAVVAAREAMCQSTIRQSGATRRRSCVSGAGHVSLTCHIGCFTHRSASQWNSDTDKLQQYDCPWGSGLRARSAVHGREIRLSGTRQTQVLPCVRFQEPQYSNWPETALLRSGPPQQLMSKALESANAPVRVNTPITMSQSTRNLTTRQQSAVEVCGSAPPSPVQRPVLPDRPDSRV